MKRIAIGFLVLLACVSVSLVAFSQDPTNTKATEVKTDIQAPANTETQATEATAQETSLIEVSKSGTVNWDAGTVRATGIGVPPQGVAAPQARLMTKRAAVADAYRLLAEAINGVRVDAESVVKNYVTESDVIKTKVSALVKGAKIVDEKRMSDGSYEVTMEVSLYGEDGLSSVMLSDKLAAGEEGAEVAAFEPQKGEITGLIVDVSGLKVEPAMAPKIVDSEGGELYGAVEKIDPDYVIKYGIVNYVKSMEAAKQDSRAGANPMVIEGFKVDPKKMFKSDIIVQKDEADKVRAADKKSKFLDAARVVVII